MRGQKVLKVKKYDYTNHPHSKLIVKKKASSHIPKWRREENEEGINNNFLMKEREESTEELIDTPDRISFKDYYNKKETPAEEQQPKPMSARDKMIAKAKGGENNGEKSQPKEVAKGRLGL